MRHARGYTVIEVMMALALLAVGATGVIALQKVALIGNTNARLGDAARQVASTWAERLKADALQWNDPLGTNDLGDTTFMKNAGTWTKPFGPPFILAPDVASWGSPLADANGVDLPVGVPATQGIFCTHLQLARMANKSFSLGGQTHPIAMRAVIRVVWRRDLAPITECRTTPPVNMETNDSPYAFYYLTTVIGQEEASN